MPAGGIGGGGIGTFGAPPRPRPSPAASRPAVGRPGLPRTYYIHGLRSTDLALPTTYTGGAATLVVKYPVAIDDMPAFTDGTTPAAAMWINILQQMIEALQAEIGPLPDGIIRSAMPPGETVIKSLKALLGEQHVESNGTSRAALCSAVAGNGKPAGTLYGVQRIQVTRTDWTSEYTSVMTNPFGFPVAIKLPIAWAYGRRPPGMTGGDFGTRGLGRIAAIVDAQARTAPGSPSVNYAVRYCASTAKAPGSSGTSFVPTVAASPGLTADICLIYMMNSSDSSGSGE